jgi:hypothetical protein
MNMKVINIKRIRRRGNISENNRMIDDIIEFVDKEDEEGVIIFVDQIIIFAYFA